MADSQPLRCLVVDDEPRLRRVLLRLLESEGHKCFEAGSGVEALQVLAREPGVTLVLSDIRMPEMDGVSLLREITARYPDVAVVMVTAVAEVDSAVACLQLGAMDYVGKPFQLEEVRARVTQALDKRRLVTENRAYHQHLEKLVDQQAVRIEEIFLEGVQALAHALEAKDPYLRGHSVRVSAYSAATSKILGLKDDHIAVVALGGELHDIGKIGVREEVLHKESQLTDDEYRHVMEHTVIGARILAPLLKNAPAAISIVRSHHERFAGRGLPDGLAGEDIPLEARIVAVGDAFDAMTSGRPYRPALTVATALAEIRKFSGVQFDPRCVDAFLTAYPEPARLPIDTPSFQPVHLGALASLRLDRGALRA
jgi:cyclic di-GMP phosphodiesterase